MFQLRSLRASILLTALLTPLLTWGLLLPGTVAPCLAQDAGTGIVTLILIPTRLEQSQELRINTGKKAELADGSYNTVYEMKRPKPEHVFLEIDVDVSVENGSLVLDGTQLRLKGEVAGAQRDYPPVDWYQNDGLTDVRGERLRVNGSTSLQTTFEVPRAEVEQLTFWLGGLRVGSVPGILSRVGVRD